MVLVAVRNDQVVNVVGQIGEREAAVRDFVFIGNHRIHHDRHVPRLEQHASVANVPHPYRLASILLFTVPRRLSREPPLQLQTAACRLHVLHDFILGTRGIAHLRQHINAPVCEGYP